MLRSNRTSSWNFFCAAVIAVLVLFSAAPAEAQGLQVFTVSKDDDQLRQIDPVTGATISSVAITLSGQTVTQGLGLAVDPTDGTMYALLNIGLATRELVTINPGTGVATDIGPADDGAGIRMVDITFATDGTLYGISCNSVFGCSASDPNTLFTIDKGTGVPTAVTVLTEGNGGHAIGFNPADNLIYHSTGEGVQNTDELFETVDPAGPTITNVPLSVDDPGFEFTALGFWGNGIFIASDRQGNIWVVVSDGRIRFLASLDHVANGVAITGTPPDCTAAGNICGAANVGQDGPSVLYSIAQASGTASMVGPIGFERVGAIAFDAMGNMWGVGETMDGNDTSTFLAIDPLSAFGLAVGPTGVSQVFDLAFRPSDGTLFATSGGHGLQTINTGTGMATQVTADTMAAGCCGNGLAFDFDDTLFHVPDVNLSTLDQTTGAATMVAAMSFSAPLDNNPRINAADFDPISGTLFGVATDSTCCQAGPFDSTLVTVDKATAVVTNIGATQLGIDAIAIFPADADIAVTKVDDAGGVAVAVNDVVTYTITVTNNGPGIASVVQLTDNFTTGTATYVAASVTTDTGTCDDSGAGAGTITCDLGAMDPAAVANISFQVTATAAGSIVDDITVTTGTNDPDTANNTAQVVTGVGSADVSVAKVENSADPIMHPGVISYTITVTGDAAATAGGVTVTDTFTGAAVTFNSAVPSQGTCNAALPIVCNLGDIAAMGMATVDVMVNTAGAGTVTETVDVTTASTDPNTANNTAVETTLVQAIDLVVTKTDSPDPTAVGGGDITYVVTVSNTGNVDATMVMLTDNFSGAAANFVSATPSQGTCTPAFPAVPCDLGTIAAGANATVTIVVTPTAGGTVTNTASATAAEPEPTPTDNTAIVQSTTVAAAQNFTLTVTPGTITILPGQAAVFTVTITPNPFIDMVTLSATGAPPLGSIAFGSSTLTPGNMVATTTMTVDTEGFFVVSLPRNQSAPLYAYWLPATAGFGAFGLLLVGANRKRLSGNRRAQFLAILSLLLAITLLAGCPLGRDREDEGTPGGTYPITVTATGGGITQMVTVNVVVQGTN